MPEIYCKINKECPYDTDEQRQACCETYSFDESIFFVKLEQMDKEEK